MPSETSPLRNLTSFPTIQLHGALLSSSGCKAPFPHSSFIHTARLTWNTHSIQTPHLANSYLSLRPCLNLTSSRSIAHCPSSRSGAYLRSHRLSLSAHHATELTVLQVSHNLSVRLIQLELCEVRGVILFCIPLECNLASRISAAAQKNTG